MAPAYDFLNTSLLIDDDEESALYLDDRKGGFDRALLIDYFGREVCGLNDRMIAKTVEQLTAVDWYTHMLGSPLSVDEALEYYKLVEERLLVLA